MKWQNKGHEYDETYARIEELSGVYLFGAGHDGELVYQVMEKKYRGIPILGYIDNEQSKQGEEKNGLKILPLSQVELRKGVGIVISFASELCTEVEEQLKEAGWCKEKNYWHYEEFLSVLAAYRYNEVFFSSICILPTTACNLRCKACLNFTTYIGKFESQPLLKLQKEIDRYFEVVDYTGLFFISGGEPLLYPQIEELIRYIGENYGDQIYELGMVTNGTVHLDDSLIHILNAYHVHLTIDDYRDAIPSKKEEIDYVIAKARKDVTEDCLRVRKYDEWISLFPHEIPKLNEKELIDKYRACHCPWQEYRDGKFYSCDYSSFANKAGISDVDMENDVFDLIDYKQDRKKELVEFRLGYTAKGYVEFCKKCAGYMDLNPYKVKAAEQEEE